jgi:hypothetical protein
MVINNMSQYVPIGARGIVRRVSSVGIKVKWDCDYENDVQPINDMWVYHNDVHLVGEDDYYTKKEKANFKAMQRVSLWGAKWRYRR